ncbi:MAG: hypothetical protein K2H34_06350 [Lachnospiraceae bacterium]|nr:hypothetical protein [Lachnospiraceae bacterium]
MLKRILVLTLLGLSAFVFTGCGKVTDLTEEETQLIAEYSAGLLLKYDLKYVDRIDEGEKAALEMTSEVEEQVATEESTTEAVTEEPRQGMDISGGINSDNTSPEELAGAGQESDVAKIAGVDGVTITYDSYVITDYYPDGGELEQLVNVQASEGYKLLVLRFKVTGKEEGVVDVSLADKGLEYRIVCNGTKAAVPMLTILPDDLGTLTTSVDNGQEQEAVLVFQISDSVKEQLETIDLYIQYNNIENAIKIL